ncbi:NADH:flavin oxidoreductase [Aestuariicella hydrocarbonica]|uniref:NADH:flavin oxidoreductase n=1 Tax=Pseudomaricurvus hydrocarbonicus TaxID=1470433 RepID=A0A9E5MPZ9_9GAMM|nr:NADH:flavin oxidoreductase [Aestuariicella hydrocarbonica]NHO68364.1 NADH:flavin oxidoreductase [Aestuariicella hydrocarbonica]
MPSADCLFRPFACDKLQLPNRVVMAPMTRSACPGNVPNERVVEYYRRRAAGGVGLIITEGTCVNHIAAHGFADVPNFFGADALAGWRRVVEAVHAEGGKIAPQLWHVGAVREAGCEPGGDTPGYSPSGISMPGVVSGHSMSQADIDEVIAAFAQAAADAKAIGMDAIELHGAHGYLIDQFFWDQTNTREDEYGGYLRQRSRFAIELITAVRAAVGPDFPIIFRFSQFKQQQYAARLVDTPEQLADFLAPLTDAGVDIYHCSVRRFWEPEFDGSPLNLAGWTQKLSGKPAIAVGSVGLDRDFLVADNGFENASPSHSLEPLFERMNQHEFDLVAVGRALIANADWPQRVRRGELDKLQEFNKELLYSLEGGAAVSPK